MARINWDIEESIALYDLYFRFRRQLSIPKCEIETLSKKLNERADRLGIVKSDKFRNVAGIRMQLGCIHYVVTDGKEGFSGASRLFYDTYKLYQEKREKFNKILENFNCKY